MKEEKVVAEEHFILRVPIRIAGTIKEIIRKNQWDDINLEFQTPRLATLSVQGEKLKGELVDLPCIIESHKTFDHRKYYKIADIGQMVVICDTNQEEYLRQNKVPVATARQGSTGVGILRDASYYSAAYQWKHGLTAPLKNVRRRRFRKRAPKKMIEDIESEVQRLLTADDEAVDVRINVYDATETEEEEDGVSEIFETETPGTTTLQSGETSELEEEFSIISEMGKDLNQGMTELGTPGENVNEGEDEEEDEESEEDSTSEEEGEETITAAASPMMDIKGNESIAIDPELLEKKRFLIDERKTIEEDIKDLEIKIERKVAQAKTTANMLLKKRFEDSVNDLKADLQMKRERLMEIAEEFQEM